MGPASFAYLLPRVDIACRPLAAAVGVIESFLFALDLVTCYLLVVAGKDRRAACLNAALAAVHGGTGTLWSIRRDSTAVDELRAGLCRASCGRMPIARAVLRRTARTCAGASVEAPAPAGVAVKPVGRCDDGGGADPRGRRPTAVNGCSLHPLPAATVVTAADRHCAGANCHRRGGCQAPAAAAGHPGRRCPPHG